MCSGVRRNTSRHTDAIKQKVDSFVAACDVVDSFMQMKRGRGYSRASLDRARDAVAKHLQLHTAASGCSNIVPKQHWLFDVIEKLRRDLAAADKEDCIVCQIAS